MKRLRILMKIMKQTKAGRIWLGFLITLLICGLIIWAVEPQITNYMDALWYCYAVVTTIGFGDVVVVTAAAKFLSVLMSLYAVMVIAIVTGVVVNYFNQVNNLRQKESLAAVIDKLEHLPELSKEELAELAEQVKNRELIK